jgi:hypothetical protein
MTLRRKCHSSSTFEAAVSKNLLGTTLGCDKPTLLAARGAKREANRKAFMVKALFGRGSDATAQNVVWW